MNASWIPPAAKANPDEYERRLRAGSARQASAEDAVLVELARRLAPVRSSPHAQAVSEPGRTDAEPMRPLEAATPQPSIAFAPDEPSGTAFDDAEATHASGFGVPYLHDPNDPGPATQRRPAGWTLKAAALAPAAGAALLGAGLVIAVFGPKGGSPELPKAPPFIAASQGPTKAPEPSGETVAIRSDPDVTPLKHTTPVKVVSSEKRPIDADASPGATPPSPPSAPAPAGAAQPTVETSAGPPVAAPVAAATIAVPPPAASQFPDSNSMRTAAAPPVAAAPIAAPRPAVSQFPDSNPVRTAAAPPVAAAPIAAPPPAASQFPESDPVRTAAAPPDSRAAPSAADAGGAARPRDTPQRPARPASTAESKAAAVAQPATPKLEAPAKLSRRTSARVMLAKTDATAPGAAAETRSQPLRPGAAMTERASAELPAAPPAPAAAEEPVNPLTHAFSTLTGALGAPAVGQTGAAKSGDWALQFPAPKSEAEAKIAAARLNAKLAPALNGATIGVQKTLVNGETIYALRVPGLSKAEAAALCERLRGRDCATALSTK